MFVGKLEIDNFYHRLCQSKHLRTLFGLPLIYTGEDTERWWPCLVTVLMGWSDSVTILQALHYELRFFGQSLSEKDELKEGDSRTDLRCSFGRDIEHFFILDTDRQNVTRTYEHIWGHLSKRYYCRYHRRASGSTKIDRERSLE